MNRSREFEVICRGCKETQRVAETDVAACLMVEVCGECGDERQPVLRAIAGPRMFAEWWRHHGGMGRRPGLRGHARA